MRSFRTLPGALGLCLVCLLLLGCRRTEPVPDPPAEPAPAAPPWFEDVTDKVGLDFTHDPGPVNDRYFLPQIIGSGGALFDADGDGRLDVLLLQNGGPAGQKNRLFRQKPDGSFEDVSAGSGLDRAGHFMGAATGDIDDDGRPDLLLTSYGAVFLFRNTGAGKFEDVTARAGLSDPLWSTSAAFFDYDRDGRLDLFLVNYLDFDPSWRCNAPYGGPDFCSPTAFPGTASYLYRNKGDGSFEDVTVRSGVGLRPGPGLGVLCADFTGDGWPDVFVANDAAANHLWVNQKDGTFTEEALARGVAFNGMGRPEGDMGIGWGDVHGDGLRDLFVTHLGVETNTLWAQGPRGFFRDRTFLTRLDRPRWRATGFGTALADFDNDGDLDVAVTNGRVARGPVLPGANLGKFWDSYAERNQLFANDGKGCFPDVSTDNPPFCGTPLIGRGLATGDVNGDGGLDLLVTAIGGRARLYFNVAPRRGHWLSVRAIDPARGGIALGAELAVRAGDKQWLGAALSASSFLSASDPRAHFGLGEVSRVDAIEVLWPDGSRETFPGGEVDREVTVCKGSGRRE